MEASREFSRTPRRLPPCSDVSVLQKTRMSQFWDTHHTVPWCAETKRTRPLCLMADPTILRVAAAAELLRELLLRQETVTALQAEGEKSPFLNL